MIQYIILNSVTSKIILIRLEIAHNNVQVRLGYAMYTQYELKESLLFLYISI